MAKLHRKFFDKSQNFFKNILNDSLPTIYTLQSRLKNLYIYCTVSFASNRATYTAVLVRT